MLLIFTLLCFAGPASAQDNIGTNFSRLDREERVRLLHQRTWEVVASPLTGDIHIDGRLDEADWQRAEPAADFFQRERNEGLPATERTEVRVLYDTSGSFSAGNRSLTVKVNYLFAF
jgi:hypothetical protein